MRASMSNLQSTSNGTNQNGNNRSQVFIVTPDMLKRMGISDKVKIIKTNARTSTNDSEKILNTTIKDKIDNVNKIQDEKLPKPIVDNKCANVSNPANLITRKIMTKNNVKIISSAVSSVHAPRSRPTILRRNTVIKKMAQYPGKVKPKTKLVEIKMTTEQTKASTKVEEKNYETIIKVQHNHCDDKNILVKPLQMDKNKTIVTIFSDDAKIKNKKIFLSAQSQGNVKKINESCDPIFGDLAVVTPETIENSVVINSSNKNNLIKPTLNTESIESHMKTPSFIFGQHKLVTYKNKKLSQKSLIENKKEISDLVAIKVAQEIVEKEDSGYEDKHKDKKILTKHVKKSSDNTIDKKMLSIESNTQQPAVTAQPATRTSQRLPKAKIFEDCITYDIPRRRSSVGIKTNITTEQLRLRKRNNKSISSMPQTELIPQDNDTKKLTNASNGHNTGEKNKIMAEIANESLNSQVEEKTAEEIKDTKKNEDNTPGSSEPSSISQPPINTEDLPVSPDPQPTVTPKVYSPASPGPSDDPPALLNAVNYLPASPDPCDAPILIHVDDFSPPSPEPSPDLEESAPPVLLPQNPPAFPASPDNISPASASPIPYVEPQSPISTEDTPPVSPSNSEPLSVEQEPPRLSTPPLPQEESAIILEPSASVSSASASQNKSPEILPNEPQLTEDTPPVSPPSLQSTLHEDNLETAPSTPVQSHIPEDNTPPVSEPSQSPQKTEQPQDTNVTPNIPKQRGRPRKTPIVEKEPDQTNTSPATPATKISETVTTTGRIKRIPLKPDEVDGKGFSDDSSGVDEDDALERTIPRGRPRSRARGRRRGRGRGKILNNPDDDYVPREKTGSKTNRKEDENETNDTTSPTSNSEITCGKCNEQIQRQQWRLHNLNKHNNTGWQSGEPVPDYENDQKLWKRTLKEAHTRKRGALNCDKCGLIRRSVDGYVSHYIICGKTEDEREAIKWICPLCRGVFMPSSRDGHERSHREAERARAIIVGRTIDTGESGGRGKRKAAQKAEKKISEFTEFVKDGDEPPSKKSKKIAGRIKDLIEHPRSTKTIPSVWKGAWSKAIENGKKACCRQPGCNFQTDVLSKIYKHHGQCNFTPSTEYVCKICKYLSVSLNELEEHIKNQHSTLIGNENDSDFNASSSDYESDDGFVDSGFMEFGRTGRGHWERANKFVDKAEFLRKERRLREGDLNKTYLPALRWTMEFERKHYESHLFHNLQPNKLELLTKAEAVDYLPELEESMKTQQTHSLVKLGVKAQQNTWKIWKQFESAVVNDQPVFFVGGPVWSMSWLPIPATKYSKNPQQYLAISTHKTMESTYAVGQSYKFKNIIQIWNLGHLDLAKTIPNPPKLAYAVAHNKGTVWCMEWCPSGSYQDTVEEIETNRRMGLLATACSDGYVHIYSLPFAEDLQFNETDDNLPIYRTDPVMSLHVNTLLHESTENNWQCVKLSWSKIMGHDTIAAGFSNGFIALWDISSNSPLLVSKIKNTMMINCIQHFYAHGQAITYVQIIPLNGRRYLATASLDRCIKYWDLENIANPQMIIKKGAVVNGAWMTHWPNILTTYDDALGLAHTVTYMIGARDPSNRTYSMLPTNSTTYSIDVSDYANGICHGTLAGEIVAIFPYQLLYLRDLDKLSRKRWLVSSIEVVDFEKQSNDTIEIDIKKESKDKKTEYVYKPETYQKCKERYGIIFHDNLDVSIIFF